MEIEPIAIIISLVIGTIIGMGYFAGLWITVQILPKAKRPVLTWGASALLRVGLATLVFLILLRWGVTQAVAGLAGFVIARLGSTVIWGPTREPKIPTGDGQADAGQDQQQPELKLEGEEDEGEADQ